MNSFSPQKFKPPLSLTETSWAYDIYFEEKKVPLKKVSLQWALGANLLKIGIYFN